MKILNFFVAITAILILGSCSPRKKSAGKPAITMLSATSQKWHGGRKPKDGEASKGIIYKCTIVAQKPLSIDSLFIGKTAYKPFVKVGSEMNPTIQENDTVVVEVKLKEFPSIEEGKESSPAGLLTYLIDGKKGFRIIEKFEELPPLNHP